MTYNLDRLQNLVTELQNTASNKDKQAILAKYPDQQDVLYYTFNPYYRYYISSENVIKQERSSLASGPNLFGGPVNNSTAGETIYTDLFDLLDALRYRKVTGLAAIRAILRFTKIKTIQHNRALILAIIDKDLQISTGVSTINKAFPDLIPTFDVALAEKYFSLKDPIDFAKDHYYASRKCDGVRCLGIIDNLGDVKLMSREGNEFDTLTRIKDEIKEVWPNLRNAVFDGEICIVDDEGNEHFDWVMKEINKGKGKGSHTIANPRYQLFDLLTFDEFNARKSTSILSERQARIVELFKTGTTPMITQLEQVLITDEDQLTVMFDKAEENNWEGLILRKDTTYLGKRSWDLLKLKSMFDGEFVVDGIESGPFGFLEDGVRKNEDMVLRLNITYTGTKPETLGLTNTVGVGTGLSREQRRAWFKDASQIVGKTITVRWFEETINRKTGLPSIRFPALKFVYEDGRNV
jgi:DNA ligase-1